MISNSEGRLDEEIIQIFKNSPNTKQLLIYKKARTTLSVVENAVISSELLVIEKLFSQLSSSENIFWRANFVSDGYISSCYKDSVELQWPSNIGQCIHNLMMTFNAAFFAAQNILPFFGSFVPHAYCMQLDFTNKFSKEKGRLTTILMDTISSEIWNGVLQMDKDSDEVFIQMNGIEKLLSKCNNLPFHLSPYYPNSNMLYYNLNNSSISQDLSTTRNIIHHAFSRSINAMNMEDSLRLNSTVFPVLTSTKSSDKSTNTTMTKDSSKKVDDDFKPINIHILVLAALLDPVDTQSFIRQYMTRNTFGYEVHPYDGRKSSNSQNCIYNSHSDVSDSLFSITLPGLHRCLCSMTPLTANSFTLLCYPYSQIFHNGIPCKASERKVVTVGDVLVFGSIRYAFVVRLVPEECLTPLYSARDVECMKEARDGKECYLSQECNRNAVMISLPDTRETEKFPDLIRVAQQIIAHEATVPLKVTNSFISLYSIKDQLESLQPTSNGDSVISHSIDSSIVLIICELCSWYSWIGCELDSFCECVDYSSRQNANNNLVFTIKGCITSKTYFQRPKAGLRRPSLRKDSRVLFSLRFENKYEIMHCLHDAISVSLNISRAIYHLSSNVVPDNSLMMSITSMLAFDYESLLLIRSKLDENILISAASIMAHALVEVSNTSDMDRFEWIRFCSDFLLMHHLVPIHAMGWGAEEVDLMTATYAGNVMPSSMNYNYAPSHHSLLSTVLAGVWIAKMNNENAEVLVKITLQSFFVLILRHKYIKSPFWKHQDNTFNNESTKLSEFQLLFNWMYVTFGITEKSSISRPLARAISTREVGKHFGTSISSSKSVSDSNESVHTFDCDEPDSQDSRRCSPSATPRGEQLGDHKFRASFSFHRTGSATTTESSRQPSMSKSVRNSSFMSRKSSTMSMSTWDIVDTIDNQLSRLENRIRESQEMRISSYDDTKLQLFQSVMYRCASRRSITVIAKSFFKWKFESTNCKLSSEVEEFVKSHKNLKPSEYRQISNVVAKKVYSSSVSVTLNLQNKFASVSVMQDTAYDHPIRKNSPQKLHVDASIASLATVPENRRIKGPFWKILPERFWQLCEKNERPLRLIYGHYSPLGAYNTLRLCDLNKPSSIPPTPSTPKALKKSHSVDLSSPAGRPSKKVWNEFSDFEMKILSIDKFWTFLRDFGVSPIFCSMAKLRTLMSQIEEREKISVTSDDFRSATSLTEGNIHGVGGGISIAGFMQVLVNLSEEVMKGNNGPQKLSSLLNLMNASNGKAKLSKEKVMIGVFYTLTVPTVKRNSSSGIASLSSKIAINEIVGTRRSLNRSLSSSTHSTVSIKPKDDLDPLLADHISEKEAIQNTGLALSKSCDVAKHSDRSRILYRSKSDGSLLKNMRDMPIDFVVEMKKDNSKKRSNNMTKDSVLWGSSEGKSTNPLTALGSGMTLNTALESEVNYRNANTSLTSNNYGTDKGSDWVSADSDAIANMLSILSKKSESFSPRSESAYLSNIALKSIGSADFKTPGKIQIKKSESNVVLSKSSNTKSVEGISRDTSSEPRKPAAKKKIV